MPVDSLFSSGVSIICPVEILAGPGESEAGRQTTSGQFIGCFFETGLGFATRPDCMSEIFGEFNLFTVFEAENSSRKRWGLFSVAPC
jgi:hypothetical protein